MEYLHFYSQEQVDKYLTAIRDGKIDVKEALEGKRSIYDYSKLEKTPDGRGLIGNAPLNPYYLTPFIAYDCHTEAGTCVAIIRPNNINQTS